MQFNTMEITDEKNDKIKKKLIEPSEKYHALLIELLINFK